MKQGYLAPKIVLVGGWDPSSPRGVQLTGVFHALGSEVHDHTHPVFKHNVGAQASSPTKLAGFVGRRLLALLINWLQLIFLSLRCNHAIFIVGYLGFLDVFILRCCRLWFRGSVIYDPYISMYDTIVMDREIIAEGGIPARILRRCEMLVFRSADLVLVDTVESGRLYSTIAKRELRVVELPVLPPEHLFQLTGSPVAPTKYKRIKVLYFGNYVPLHGCSVIVRALEKLRSWDVPFEASFIGDGQDRKETELLARNLNLDIKFLESVELDNLIEHIDASDLIFGVFGKSAKASRVVPNKVWLAAYRRRPVISLYSSAVERQLGTGVIFTQSPDPVELASVIRNVMDSGFPASFQFLAHLRRLDVAERELSTWLQDQAPHC